MSCDCQCSVALPRCAVGLSVVNPDDTRLSSFLGVYNHATTNLV